MPPILTTIGYVLVSYLVARQGARRKFGFWGYFFGSLLFTPVVGLLLVIAADEPPADPPAPTIV